jgi:hypothetical protein
VKLEAAEGTVRGLVVSTVNLYERPWAGFFLKFCRGSGADRLRGLFGLLSGGLGSNVVWQLFDRGRRPGFWKQRKREDPRQFRRLCRPSGMGIFPRGNSMTLVLSPGIMIGKFEETPTYGRCESGQDLRCLDDFALHGGSLCCHLREFGVL